MQYNYCDGEKKPTYVENRQGKTVRILASVQRKWQNCI